MTVSIPPNNELRGEGWVRVEDARFPHPMTIRVELNPAGRLVATGLLIEADGELTASDLRFRLAEVVTEVASAASKTHTRERLWRERLKRFGIEYVQEGPEPPASDVSPHAWRWLLPLSKRRRLVPRRTRPGPPGHDKAFYEGVADAYRRAQLEHPRRPIQSLMDELAYSEAQIHRFLREARARDLLPPPTKGRSSAKKAPRRR